MSTPTEAEIEQIADVLKEILNWIKLENKPRLRELLIKELDTEEKKRIYELTNGARSQYDIESTTSVSRRMVGYYWQKWSGIGIVVNSDRRKGRMQKIISLDEVGIAVSANTGRREEEIEFLPEDLKDVLSNQKIFPDNSQLQRFAFDILPESSGQILNPTREQLVNVIIDSFQQSDRIKQSLFLQALERRATEREITAFSKFFRAWEKQIGK